MINGAAIPRPQALVAFITREISSTSSRHDGRSCGPACPFNRSFSLCVPMRQGKHLPQDSSAKNAIAS